MTGLTAQQAEDIAKTQRLVALVHELAADSAADAVALLVGAIMLVSAAASSPMRCLLAANGGIEQAIATMPRTLGQRGAS